MASSAYPCTDCVLHETAPTVCIAPHSPSDDPLFAVIGEAPDREDPINGPSLRLLWDELKEYGLHPSQAHVSTVVKCAPPEGYKIKQREVKACSLYLMAELAWLKSETNCKAVLAVGTAAFKALGGTGNITQAQGMAYEYEGFTIVPVLHPYGAIRSPRRMEEFRRAVHRFASLVTGKVEHTESEVALVNALH